MDFSGGPIILKDRPPVADALNQRIVTRADMDPASVVAVAGTVESGVIEKAQAELARKFPDASADMMPSTDGLAPKYVVAYAYFREQLPFEFAFDRSSSLPFGRPPAQDAKDTRPKVDWFGLDEYYPGQHGQDKLAAQVKVIWHKFGKEPSPDSPPPQEFIVELLTKVKNDRLILARVEPGKDLMETTQRVMEHLPKPNTAGIKEAEANNEALNKFYETERADESEESHAKRRETAFLAYNDRLSQCGCLWELEDIKVPVIELDLKKEFTDLHRAIESKNPKLDGMPIFRASQNIRFKLDETGANLETKSDINAAGVASRSFIFDQPFLVLLIQKGAKQPYFALWVGNAELLVRSGR